MPLTNSNTYVEPTAGTSLNSARLLQNDTYRSLLTNFKSSSAPAALNISAEGVAIGEQDGMLYRSATTNALYISDTVHKKSSPVGGNFTRVGIGNRIENGIVALGANATSYEIGELVATVSEDGTLSANARVYLCVSNSSTTGSTASFIDVGLPTGYSIGDLANVSFSGESVRATNFIATTGIGIGTDVLTSAEGLTISSTAPRIDLIEEGTTRSSVFARDANNLVLQTRSNTGVFISEDYAVTSNATGANTHSWSIANAVKLRLNSLGYLSVNSASATNPLTVNGTANVTAIRITSTNDALLASTDHGLQIGDTSGTNLIIDNNEIMVRNNGTTAGLYLNKEGGGVYLGTSSSTVTTSGTASINKVRITSTSDATLTSTEHGFQIGDTSGLNLLIDNNEIVARNAGAASTLTLNATGGNVNIGNSGSTVSITGTLSADIKSSINATGSAPIYAARAWVMFDSSGNIYASRNVSSISNLGSYIYRVNYTTAMPSTNYGVVTSTNRVGDYTETALITTQTTTYCGIATRSYDGGVDSSAMIYAVIFA